MSARKIVAAVLTLALMCSTGCASGQGETLSVEELRLNSDVVLALRFSPEAYEVTNFNKSGYIVLVKADGSFQAADIGPMDDAEMIWDSDSLYFGGSNSEYQLRESDIVISERSSYQDMETARALLPDGKGFMAVYNVGFEDDDDYSKGYNQLIVTNEKGVHTELQVSGFADDIATCGDRIVEISEYKYLKESDKEIISAPEHSELVMQMYPRPNSIPESVLVEIEGDPAVEIGTAYSHQIPCVNNKMYALSSKVGVAEDGSYYNLGSVLRVFDINSGEYKTIPLTNADPNSKQLGTEELVIWDGQLSSDNKSYIWVSDYDWTVREVDLQTGVVSEKFKVEVTNPDVPSRVVMTDKFLFVLDEVSNSKPFKLVRYDLSTGQKTDLFEIRDLHTINRRAMTTNGLQAMALNPAWVEEQEGS